MGEAYSPEGGGAILQAMRSRSRCPSGVILLPLKRNRVKARMHG